MSQTNITLPNLRFFGPEVWDAVKRFREFYSATFAFDKIAKRAVVGVGAHLDKAIDFYRIANEWRPRLALDQAELEANGFTPAQNTRDLALIIEAIILESYASLDCAAKVIRAVYGKQCRGFRNSARFLFLETDKIEGPLPFAIRDALASATCVERLRFMRDELTLLATGSCSLDHETGLVRYFHSGLTENDKPLHIEDIFAWLEETLRTLDVFLATVFYALNGELTDTPIMQICGMTGGRMLARMVGYTRDLSFNSGTCSAYIWFEKPDLPTCPFADDCGAYVRTKEYLERGVSVPNPYPDDEV